MHDATIRDPNFNHGEMSYFVVGIVACSPQYVFSPPNRAVQLHLLAQLYIMNSSVIIS